MRESIEEQIQPTRRKLLEALKRASRLSADELAKVLGITSMGVRRHLTTLERDGLVAYDVVQRGMGRPTYLYYLTELGDELFPKRYPELTAELLHSLANLEGHELIERLFRQRAQKRLRRAETKCGDARGLQRLKALVDFLNEDGYMAELSHHEGHYVLCQYNCPIKHVAREYPCACSAEVEFLHLFLGVPVRRAEHALAGSHCCSYCISFE